MVSKLGNHDVGQQPSGWDALVDDLSRNRCLDKRFAVIADPFATYMTLDGEHARCVIQLLTDIFTDAFQRAAAWAVSVVRFVMDQCAWKLSRQCSALGLLLFLGRRWHCLQGLKLCFNRCDICI